MIHELGHYLTARLFGVAIHEFAIGMGPRLFKWTSKKTGIDYSLRLLPIGGFVDMVGEDEETDDDGALNRKPVWQRMIITSAGAAMNILLGFILMLALVLSAPRLSSTTVLRFHSEDSITKQSGLLESDEILSIGGSRVHTSLDIICEVMRKGSEPVDLVVRRAGEKIKLEDVSFAVATEDGLSFGQIDFSVQSMPKTFTGVLKQTWYQSLTSIKLIWTTLYDTLRGRYGIEQLSGPVGVTKAIGEAASAGPASLLLLCELISMNLGVFNLLPLPALDGGRIVFLLIELVRRKPIKPEYEGYVHLAGIILLMGLMIIITYKDIMQLFAG